MAGERSGKASEGAKKAAKKGIVKKSAKKVGKKAVGAGGGGAAGRPAKKVAKKAAGKTVKPAGAGKGGGSGGRGGEGGPVLLSGGNPQIAKGDGAGPVRAYIEAMPGWKGDVGRRLDDLIVRTAPGVRKAVRWNTPFYGMEGQGWFLGFHCITRYVKVAFFNGASLRPPPPVASKQKNVRYLHIHEGDWGSVLDEEQLASWIRQASELPGERCF